MERRDSGDDCIVVESGSGRRPVVDMELGIDSEHNSQQLINGINSILLDRVLLPLQGFLRDSRDSGLDVGPST